jgi:hypothetical protein
MNLQKSSCSSWTGSRTARSAAWWSHLGPAAGPVRLRLHRTRGRPTRLRIVTANAESPSPRQEPVEDPLASRTPSHRLTACAATKQLKADPAVVAGEVTRIAQRGPQRRKYAQLEEQAAGSAVRSRWRSHGSLAGVGV